MCSNQLVPLCSLPSLPFLSFFALSLSFPSLSPSPLTLSSLAPFPEYYPFPPLPSTPHGYLRQWR